MDYDAELLSLREENAEIRRQFALLAEQVNMLKEENERLKRELAKYKNSNTPPSANPHLKQAKPTCTNGGKRGRPAGCEGSNRPVKEADETRTITAKECPNCHDTDLELVSVKRQQIEELPPVKPVVVDVYRDVLRCNSCDLEFVSRDGRTPIQGRFGIDLVVIVIFIRFIVRGVLRKTAGFLAAGFALQLAPASVHAIISRAAQAAESEYVQLKENVRTAKILYVDETSFSVLGRNWWVWAFRSERDLLLVLRNSRGNNVLEEILGKEYRGVLVCDCWRAYDYLSNARLQRCWAHLLRKSKELCDTVAGRHLHCKLCLMFAEIERFNRKQHSETQRTLKYERMTIQLHEMIAYYSRYKEFKGVTKYVSFHTESWFTCIRHEGVEPTNNHAERAIRETVVIRKIIGAFRSESGTRTYETLASLLATWQLQEKDVKQELRRVLSQNMC